MELLHFARDGATPHRERHLTEPGLPHLPFGVDNRDVTCDLARQQGGTVIDPPLIEVLPRR